MSKTIVVPGRFHSIEKGNVLAGANEVLDDTKGKKQNVINAEVDAELLRLDQTKQDNLTFDNTPTEDSTNPVTSGGVFASEELIRASIEAILILIPSAASELNKLVDTNLLNSSIGTATATFRGTSETGLTEQEFLAWANGLTHDLNDYVFWQTVDSDGNTLFKRYKWDGTQWLYEYTLNNSSFTAAQWAAIQSGITAALVEKLSALPTNAALAELLAAKQDVLTFDNNPTSGSSNPVKSGGVYTAISDEAAARGNEDTRLAGLIGDEETRAKGVEGGLDTRLGAAEGAISGIQQVIPSGATSLNQLVDTNTLATYVAAIVTNMDATFNVTTTDGHITLHVMQVDGIITSVQVQSTDIASAAALTIVTNNVSSLTGRMGTAETNIANLQQLYNNLQQSKPVPVTSLPSSGQQQGVIYRLAGTTSYSDYMWNGSSWVLMATYNNAIDATPTYNSGNLVTSGGVENMTRYLSQDYQCFRRYKTSAADGYCGGALDANLKSAIYKSFLTLKIKGFDKTQPCKLSYFMKNNSGSYRLIFDSWNGTSWTKVFDASITNVETPNPGGINVWQGTYGSKKVLAIIDYSMMSDGYGWIDGTEAAEPNFVVRDECFDDGLGETPIYEKDLHEEIISDNIANPANIQQGYAILNDGALYEREGWAVIYVPVSEGQVISFGGFDTGGETAYYSFFNGATAIGDYGICSNSYLPKTVTVPSGCNRLYIDIKRPESPAGAYDNLMINYGSRLLPRDEYEIGVTSIKGHELAGKGSDEQLESRVGALEDAVYDNIGTLIADLPVSDGTGIETGYAYIDSTTGVVKIKMS